MRISLVTPARAAAALAIALSVLMVPIFAQSSAVTEKAGQPARAVPTSTPLNINTATSVELEALPGVGPATAARIVEYRQKNGAFKKVEDLMNVRGIGEKTFLTLKPLIAVASPKGDPR